MGCRESRISQFGVRGSGQGRSSVEEPMNRIDLTNRRAVVTGGAQGIGRATVERFLDSGAIVSIWDMDADELKKAAAELDGRGRVHTAVVDVGNVTQVGSA